MKLFNVNVTDTDEEFCVAARGFDHAAEVFITFWAARTGDAPGEFSIDRGAPSSCAGHPTVHAVAHGNVAGVFVRQTDATLVFESAIGA